MWNLLAGLLSVPALLAQTLPRSVTDPGVVTTRQTISPAGVPSIFGSRVYGTAFGESSREVWVLTANKVYRLDWSENKILGEWPLGGSPGLQGIRFDRAAKSALVTRMVRDADRKNSPPRVEVVAWNASGPSRVAESGTQLAGGVALANDKRLGVVPLTFNNKAAVIDMESKSVLSTIPVGIAPFGAAVSSDGQVAYVTNWGGRLPKKGDLTAPTGDDPGADQVVVDARGIASTGSVTRIDLAAKAATHQIATGLHPTATAWDEAGKRLYVVNANSDSISVIDTATQRLTSTISLQPFAQKAHGVAPSAIAISNDGDTAYIACGGINAIAVLDTTRGTLRGLIPTAWYPSSLSLSHDGKRLAVGALLGIGSGWREEPKKRYVHAYRGSVSIIELPDPAQLAAYTVSVSENNHLPLASGGRVAPVPLPRAGVAPVPVPERAGEPSTIEHVVLIIRENRTYDQVFGDLPKGNGDPSLVMFGRDVTPNAHRLAEEFVLLDNFYATGGNSADGHQWLTQANETGYPLWPGYTGRSYPFDGSDPIAPSSSGFLWDAALSRKKTVRIYGEYAGLGDSRGAPRAQLLKEWKDGGDFSSRFQQSAPIASLNKILAKNYPAYNIYIPDVIRAQIFNKDVEQWEREASMPNLVMLLLPSDHTLGASPGQSTPAAMVADNDLALGQIVEALTKSRFWPKMAIFVIEDDAQNGVDHVDGHRTVALAISPYTRRGHIDSTFYASQSILKTIELILGLPHLSLFDLIANDMRNSFTNTADLRPYTAVEPKQSLFDANPTLRTLRGDSRRAAIHSARMNWTVPDAAPTDRLNRILWHQVHGSKRPYPGTKAGLFTPLSLEVDDDDRE
ncbi:MAG TPA: bifunctional YncE family protein/alkaline phosphatase family protein [Bryobacteraceae bacterium]|nr:bifunctional YncE family protein/alkaline phosphatase family protein [Bryobacteraceae bacterium]